MKRKQAQIIADLTAAAKVRTLSKRELAQLEYQQGCSRSWPHYKRSGSAGRVYGPRHGGVRRSPAGQPDILDHLARMNVEELEGVRLALLGREDERAPVALRVVEAEIWARGQTARGWNRVNNTRFTIITGPPIDAGLAT